MSRQKKEWARWLWLSKGRLKSTRSVTSMKTSSKPKRSQRAFQENEDRKA